MIKRLEVIRRERCPDIGFGGPVVGFGFEASDWGEKGFWDRWDVGTEAEDLSGAFDEAELATMHGEDDVSNLGGRGFHWGWG